MVASFRTTFTGWLDQRLVSDLYVTLEDQTDVPALMAFLETRSEAVLPIWSTEKDVLGAPAEIYGVADHPIYVENWPLLEADPDVWERIALGEGALINEQLSRRESLGPGDRLPLPDGGDVTVTGVYSDYGNSLGQVVLPLSVLVERYPEADQRDFGVLTANVEQLRNALVAEFGLPEANLVDQRALKAFSLSIFERTFAVTGALNVLTLAVAGVAILTSLLTLASMRLPAIGAGLGPWAGAQNPGADRTCARPGSGRAHLCSGGFRSDWVWPGSCSRSSTSRRLAGDCRCTCFRWIGSGCWRCPWRQRVLPHYGPRGGWQYGLRRT